MPTRPGNHSWFFAFSHWNWKAAFITAVFRGAACMAALRHVHPHQRQHFSAVEMIYVLLTAGVFSAWQQQALSIRPKYCAWLAVVVVVPLTSLGADAVTHLWLDHVHAPALGVSALVLTLVSAMFHWHVMENGVMIVGDQGRSLMADLKAIPRLLLTFVLAPVQWLRNIRAPQAPEEVDLELAA